MSPSESTESLASKASFSEPVTRVSAAATGGASYHAQTSPL